MAGLRSLYKDQPGLESNFDVDYAIQYKIPPAERVEAEASFVRLIETLSAAGLATTVRDGGSGSLLVFAKIASEGLLNAQVYRYRVQDWLYGVRSHAPDKDLRRYFDDEPVSEAERLRLAYLLITKPRSEGGAGITPGTGQWRFVAAVFPLHDHAFNKSWLKRWGTKYFPDETDINQIRDKFGEKVAFYFAFLESYFTFLLFPAAFGFASWLLLGKFSLLYAVVNSLWSVVFFEYWKVKEHDLAVRWGVRGVSKIQHPRPQFRAEGEAQDPVTGEAIRLYSPFKRLARQLLQVPFALACVVILGGLIAGCFAIEIFISEVYTGPFKQYLVFLPTVILTVFMPAFSTLLTGLAERLTHFENYETQDAHESAFVQKVFVLNLVASYLPIGLTAFVYVPLGKILVPYLDVFQLTAQRFTSEGKPLPTKEFEIDPDRLSKQVIYFTVTAQVVNFALEVIVPYAKRKAFRAVREVQNERSPKAENKSSVDAPEEAAFLDRVRNEAELDEYDVTIDHREMVVQFGYLSLFSVIWPLTACSFLANNWVEARSDAMKIAMGSQRPIPWRADSIGPWLNALGFLSWLGSLTSAALVFLFHGGDNRGPAGSPATIRAWALLLSVMLAEHVYLVAQLVVRYVIEKMDRPGLRKEKAERFAMRKHFLQESLGHQDAAGDTPPVGSSLGGSDKEITREGLEEEVRLGSIEGHDSPEELFWRRQRGPGETIEMGRRLISEAGKPAPETPT